MINSVFNKIKALISQFLFRNYIQLTQTEYSELDMHISNLTNTRIEVILQTPKKTSQSLFSISESKSIFIDSLEMFKNKDESSSDEKYDYPENITKKTDQEIKIEFGKAVAYFYGNRNIDINQINPFIFQLAKAFTS